MESELTGLFFIFYVLYGLLFAATAFQSERPESQRERETVKDTYEHTHTQTEKPEIS